MRNFGLHRFGLRSVGWGGGFRGGMARAKSPNEKLFDAQFDMKIFFLLSILFLSLAGCSTTPEHTAEKVEKLRTPPAEAMVECAGPTPLTDPSMGAIARKLVEASSRFHECSSKHKELKAFIERGEK